MKEQFEITVWCTGQVDGWVFPKQSGATVQQVVKCVGLRYTFGLYLDDNTYMVFAKDKVINVQIKSMYGEGEGL